MEAIYRIICNQLQLNIQPVKSTIKLLDEGASIPFISRYRKEATGGLDEVVIESIHKKYNDLIELGKRKETILKTIQEQDKLTPELERRIEETWDATTLEDLYLPFKPKRRTRAEIAKEKGLEPLAQAIMLQQNGDYNGIVRKYLNDNVASVDEAIKGAQDIIAEVINENETVRNVVRRYYENSSIIQSKVVKGKEEEGDKYRDYFDFSERLSRCSSHRLLAIRRGESEGFLRVNIAPEEDLALERLEKQFVKGDNEAADYVYDAVKDAYKRLLKPSIETEFATLSKEKADEQAIHVFAENLRQLLLAPPLGQYRVLVVDPGYRTGCKLVCLDAQGNLLHNETIYPHAPQN